MQEKCIFNNEDFKSSDGMLTYVWGPSLWHFLHTMSFNYPVKPTKDDKQHYMNFIHSLKFILPCKYCRMNLSRNLKETHFSLKNMKSRETFSKYVFNLWQRFKKTRVGKMSTRMRSLSQRRLPRLRSLRLSPIRKLDGSICRRVSQRCTLGNQRHLSNFLNFCGKVSFSYST